MKMILNREEIKQIVKLHFETEIPWDNTIVEMHIEGNPEMEIIMVNDLLEEEEDVDFHEMDFYQLSNACEARGLEHDDMDSLDMLEILILHDAGGCDYTRLKIGDLMILCKNKSILGYNKHDRFDMIARLKQFDDKGEI